MKGWHCDTVSKAPSLLIKLLANGLQRAAEDDLRVWAPGTHM